MKINLCHKILLVFIYLALFNSNGNVFGQNGSRFMNPDSLRMVELYDQARTLYAQDMKMEALSSAEGALQFSMRLDQSYHQIRILDFIGDIYVSIGEDANSIPYFLRTINLLGPRNDNVRVSRLYEKIALAYRHEEVYEKELDYYSKAFQLLPGEKYADKHRIKDFMAVAAFNAGKMSTAEEFFRELTSIYQKQGDHWLGSMQYMIKVFDASSKYDSALLYCQGLLPVYEERADENQVFRLQNNIGYYQTLLGDFRSASKSYLQAYELGERAGVDPIDIALMLTNAGVCFQNMEDKKKSTLYFTEAIRILNENDQKAEQSRVENMLATIYFQERDLYNAGQFGIRAIESAKEAGNPVRESEAYLIYSQVLRDGNDPINALEYYEKYLKIRDSISLDRKMREQDLEKRRFMLEKEERDLQLRLKEEEVSDLAIKQLMLQNDKIEQEKALLMNEKNLQLLEQERLQQDMVIAKQKLKTAQQEKENQALEKIRMDQEIAITKQKLDSIWRVNEINDLENQRKIDQDNIEKEAYTKRVFIGVSAGGFIIAIIVLLLLISTRKKKKLLALQKMDLEQKNEEISTQRDEIEAQRNLVFEQKEAIEASSEEIQMSIAYAKRIQSSTLPDTSLMKEDVSDTFVLFRPRDVVSGDFYWYAKVEGKTVFAVADSTGHGVPGAFMSVMGTSLLKEIVQKEYITHPGVILRRMRKEIINAMGQKGLSGEQRDGYDIALITIDHSESKVDYAGAYNSLYLVREKGLPAPDLDEIREQEKVSNDGLILYEIQADKMPIAHYDRMDKFNNKTFPVFKGDIIYMFTDGYADQFGGENDKKFMYKPFKQLLLSNAKLPMEEQHKQLSDTLTDWMGMHAQIDDICVMGIKI